MIKINLYPYVRKKREFSIEMELGIYIFIFLFLSAILVYVNLKMNSHINNLSQIKSQKESINRMLRKKVVIINNYKKQITTLNKKIEVIKKIRKEQNLPVIYLTELVKRFIKDKLWFTQLSMGSNKKIELGGVALDNQILAEYITRLRNSKYIQEVYLKKSVKKNIMGFDLISFNFSVETKNIMEADKP